VVSELKPPIANANPVLSRLKIKNLAVIEEVEISFGTGFTVVTGETGAGKSVMVGAIGLLMGERAGADLIRAGEKEASIECVFDLTAVPEKTADPYGDGDELFVRRAIGADGRSRAYINGVSAPLSTLSSILSKLVDISSQHAHQALSREENHIKILDSFAGIEGLIEDFKKERIGVLRMLNELAEMKNSATDHAAREDFLRFQLKEIESVNPIPGEEETLSAERKVLQNAGRLSDGVNSVVEMIYSGAGAACGLVKKASNKLNEAASIDPRLSKIAAMLEQAEIALEESSTDLRGYSSGLDFSPLRLDEVEERLASLSRLKRKHAPKTGTIEEVVQRRMEIVTELEGFSGKLERIPELEKTVTGALEKCLKLGRRISEKRKEAAVHFSAGITCELAGVAMPGAVFEVKIEGTAPAVLDILNGTVLLREDGFDEAVFLFSANPGEPARPLQKIASGGELSRMMLAVKHVLSGRDPVPVCIFDEVDSGIGGATAEVIGRHLRDISKGRQVVCITHLPQIASLASNHLKVIKTERGGRTNVALGELDENDRVMEIARMLGGLNITPATIDHAKEMLASAGLIC